MVEGRRSRRKQRDLDVGTWRREDESVRETGENETETGGETDPDHEIGEDDHEAETDTGDAEVTAETVVETDIDVIGEAEVGTEGDQDPSLATEGIRKRDSVERVEIRSK